MLLAEKNPHGGEAIETCQKQTSNCGYDTTPASRWGSRYGWPSQEFEGSKKLTPRAPPPSSLQRLLLCCLTSSSAPLLTYVVGNFYFDACFLFESIVALDRSEVIVSERLLTDILLLVYVNQFFPHKYINI